MMRLNKYIAHCGVCSRRKAAELVKSGEIKVNNQVEINPAYEVKAKDVVTYLGKRLKPETKMVYVLLNKPKNTITTVKDDKNRRTVMDLIKNRVEERVFPVGRLDRNTTGLLLLTNDGDLAKKLSHPKYKVVKYYEVSLDKEMSESDLGKIRKGLELEDGSVEVDSVDYLAGRPKNELGIEIHIGKNRIVRRIFEHLGYEVIRLDRTYYAGLTKKNLPRGWSRLLTKKEIIMLKHFV